MITDKQFSDWAQSSTRCPVLLIEISHKDGTVYLSDHLYFTGASDTPAHVSYDVCLKQTVLVERTLDQDSLGAIRVYNDGSLDEWLGFVWQGYSIEIFIGDKNWERADFRKQYKGVVESFEQLNPRSFEFKSTLSTSIVQTELYNKNNLWVAGEHTSTDAVFIGNFYGNKRWRIANTDQFDRSSVSVTYNNIPVSITWVDELTWNTFHVDDYVATATSNVRFSCSAFEQKFKSLFETICTYINQPFNVANLAAYPIDPDVTFHISQNMTFPEFLTVSLETLGALLWINDEGEIELYRKELPETVTEDTVNSWITPNDEPVIKTITTEDPAAVVQVKNPDFNHNSEDGPTHEEYNALDLAYPYRTVITHSYAKDSEAIIEGRRLADLLAVTRRTYSITINRISPELFIGAIVNVYSPKDGWHNNGEGLNALVVGFTQSYKQDKSELIVWR